MSKEGVKIQRLEILRPLGPRSAAGDGSAANGVLEKLIVRRGSCVFIKGKVPNEPRVGLVHEVYRENDVTFVRIAELTHISRIQPPPDEQLVVRSRTKELVYNPLRKEVNDVDIMHTCKVYFLGADEPEPLKVAQGGVSVPRPGFVCWSSQHPVSSRLHLLQDTQADFSPEQQEEFRLLIKLTREHLQKKLEEEQAVLSTTHLPELASATESTPALTTITRPHHGASTPALQASPSLPPVSPCGDRSPLDPKMFMPKAGGALRRESGTVGHVGAKELVVVAPGKDANVASPTRRRRVPPPQVREIAVLPTQARVPHHVYNPAAGLPRRDTQPKNGSGLASGARLPSGDSGEVLRSPTGSPSRTPVFARSPNGSGSPLGRPAGASTGGGASGHGGSPGQVHPVSGTLQQGQDTCPAGPRRSILGSRPSAGVAALACGNGGLLPSSPFAEQRALDTLSRAGPLGSETSDIGPLGLEAGCVGGAEGGTAGVPPGEGLAEACQGLLEELQKKSGSDASRTAINAYLKGLVAATPGACEMRENSGGVVRRLPRHEIQRILLQARPQAVPCLEQLCKVVALSDEATKRQLAEGGMLRVLCCCLSFGSISGMPDSAKFAALKAIRRLPLSIADCTWVLRMGIDLIMKTISVDASRPEAVRQQATAIQVNWDDVAETVEGWDPESTENAAVLPPTQGSAPPVFAAVHLSHPGRSNAGEDTSAPLLGRGISPIPDIMCNPAEAVPLVIGNTATGQVPLAIGSTATGEVPLIMGNTASGETPLMMSNAPSGGVPLIMGNTPSEEPPRVTGSTAGGEAPLATGNQAGGEAPLAVGSTAGGEEESALHALLKYASCGTPGHPSSFRGVSEPAQHSRAPALPLASLPADGLPLQMAPRLPVGARGPINPSLSVATLPAPLAVPSLPPSLPHPGVDLSRETTPQPPSESAVAPPKRAGAVIPEPAGKKARTQWPGDPCGAPPAGDATGLAVAPVLAEAHATSRRTASFALGIPADALHAVPDDASVGGDVSVSIGGGPIPMHSPVQNREVTGPGPPASAPQPYIGIFDVLDAVPVGRGATTPPPRRLSRRLDLSARDTDPDVPDAPPGRMDASVPRHVGPDMPGGLDSCHAPPALPDLVPAGAPGTAGKSPTAPARSSGLAGLSSGDDDEVPLSRLAKRRRRTAGNRDAGPPVGARAATSPTSVGHPASTQIGVAAGDAPNDPDNDGAPDAAAADGAEPSHLAGDASQVYTCDGEPVAPPPGTNLTPAQREAREGIPVVCGENDKCGKYYIYEQNVSVRGLKGRVKVKEFLARYTKMKLQERQAKTEVFIQGDEQGRCLAEYLWEKCCVCWLPTDVGNMLMCETEGCNFLYHTYCLQPPLASIPEGEWHCPPCQRGEPLRRWLPWHADLALGTDAAAPA